MIPLKLELKNFLSYGEDVQIDFKDYPLICFSGKNGNGKSAILDAITWVIWGQARKISGTIKPDLGLLRLGQTNMVVCLEFEFAKNIYRVRREFAKTYGKSYAALDLELFDIKKEKFVCITDKTIRLTQEKIEKLLGLDYETFVNSAFLRQGLADEFSKKSPKERKQILSNILGFSRYDELQSLALEQVRTYQDEKKITLKLQEQYEIQIEKEKEINKEFFDQKRKIEEINKKLSVLQNDSTSIEKEKEIFLQQKHKYNYFIKEQEELNYQIKLKHKALKEIIIEWKKVHYGALHLPNIENLENEKFILNQKEKEYLFLQQKSLSLQELILQKRDCYQKQLNILKEKIENEVFEKKLHFQKKEFKERQLLDQIDQKEKVKKELNNDLKYCKKELLSIEKQLENQKEFEIKFKQFKACFEKRRSFYQVLIQKGNWINIQKDELEQKYKSMKVQKSPSCPLCDQILTIKRKHFLGLKFKKEIIFLNNRFIRISKLIKKLKDILFEQHEELKRMIESDEIYKKANLKKQDTENELNKKISKLKEIYKDLEDLNNEICFLSKDIKNEKEKLIIFEEKLYKELNEKMEVKELYLDIEKLDNEKKLLQYDKNIHLELQNKLDKINFSLKELEVIKNGLMAQNERKSKIRSIIKKLKELKKILLKKEEECKKLNFDFRNEIKLEEDFDKIKIHIKEVILEKEKNLQQMGWLENELNRIKELKEEKDKIIFRLNFLNEEIEDFQLLSQAFGKNGIQALLIEDIIPQIEEEANNILARLTDNQAQVFIESLRDLKGGGVKETLDIQISDSAGIRPYEMFSGGEAFRVDFALRIAISKLLARRSGTALQTLIIDEGFGSQDEEGLSRLMDAIYAIQKDFSKIIVVSHLNALKDNFPIHFLVEKNASGSFIKVEQRG